LILWSSNALADKIPEFIEKMTPVRISQIFDEQNQISLDGLSDLIDREEKIGKCSEDYINKQSKSYAKKVQNNLYDLIHNFDRITSKIYGKNPSPDEIPYDEKIEALARVQCEAYYTMGVLK